MCPEPRAPRAYPLLLSALATAVLAAGCVVPPLPPPMPAAAPVSPPPAPVSAPAPKPGPQATPQEPAVAMPVQGSLPGAVRTDSSATTTTLLAYAERLRRMPAPELAQELTRLADIAEPQRQPAEDLQLALALAQTRAGNDLARAQALVQRVLANSRDEARGLHPLAGMLAARYAEQRRVEDALERQAQQLREQQRRIEQLNERLEAVRAIERSLTSRPPPPATNGSHKPQQP